MPVAQSPGLNIVKDAVPGQTADAGGRVAQLHDHGSNTGNTTLTGRDGDAIRTRMRAIVRVADAVGDNDNLLEVGETWAYTAAHTVTQAEIDSNGGGDG